MKNKDIRKAVYKLKGFLYSILILYIILVTETLYIDQNENDQVIENAVSTLQNTEDEPKGLYAQSAVLMDADSGRVLFGKNENELRPMASTTKILTCIVALEEMEKNQIATVSKEAERQPKVRLGIKEHEKYRVEDLLYSLMLESHNDSAVVVAEAISGDVNSFAELLNKKAREIGCQQSHFVTPNGLDAEDTGGKHATTAVELSKIMKYCIMDSPLKDRFLKITRTKEYVFSDLDGKRTFQCNNHNAFLDMMEGAMSGKTGFTSQAGYCYVGALRSEGRTFIVSLLGCGWPNHKGYKWIDTKKLMMYGMDHYHYRDIWKEPDLKMIKVKNGVGNASLFIDDIKVPLKIESDGINEKVLLKDDDIITTKTELPKVLYAPIKKGKQVGVYIYYLNGKKYKEYKVIADRTIREKSFQLYLSATLKWFFMVENIK